MITKFFKGMTPEHISQKFHSKHQALDIIGNDVLFGYGTPLCAPENCLVLGITLEILIPGTTKGLENGYGIRLKGLETGHEYLFWHCLPFFPVWGGETVPRGQIVAFMGNSGNVYAGGKYVPLEDRDQLPFDPKDPEEDGLHVHVETFLKGKKVDPTTLINWSWEPSYTKIDLMKATVKVLEKVVRLYNRQV